MKCTRCGHINEQDAIFCAQCGANFDQQRYSMSKAPSSRKKAIIAAVIGIIVVVIASLLIYHTTRTRKIKNLKSQVVAAENAGNDEQALALTQSLYDLTGDDLYLNDVRRLQSKIKWKSTVDETLNFISDGNFTDAYENIVKLSSEGSGALAVARDLKNTFYGQLQQMIDEKKAKGNTADVTALLGRLIAMGGDNQRLEDMLASLKTEKSTPPPAPTKKTQTKAKASSNGASLTTVAQNIKNKNLTATAISPNVRSGPGLDYPVLYSLSKGDTIYVSDTQVNGNIVWLYIGDGWVSHKNFNGDLYY